MPAAALVWTSFMWSRKCLVEAAPSERPVATCRYRFSLPRTSSLTQNTPSCPAGLAPVHHQEWPSSLVPK